MNRQLIAEGAPWSVAEDPFAPISFAKTGHKHYIIDKNGDEYRYSGSAGRNWYTLAGAEQQAHDWNLKAAETIMTQGTRAAK